MAICERPFLVLKQNVDPLISWYSILNTILDDSVMLHVLLRFQGMTDH